MLAGADHALAQSGEPFRRDPACRQAVLLEDRRERQRRARRRIGFLPVLGSNSCAIASISARACVSAATNASARSAPSGKKRCEMTDAAQLQGFEALRDRGRGR